MFIAFSIICGYNLWWRRAHFRFRGGDGPTSFGVNVPLLCPVSGYVPNSVLRVEAAPNTPSEWSVATSHGHLVCCL